MLVTVSGCVTSAGVLRRPSGPTSRMSWRRAGGLSKPKSSWSGDISEVGSGDRTPARCRCLGRAWHHAAPRPEPE